MRRLIRLAIIIVLIVLCFRCVRNCGNETVKVVAEVFTQTIDQEIEVTEPSEDPYDKLYVIEDENSVQGKTLREIGSESWKEVKESMEVE